MLVRLHFLCDSPVVEVDPFSDVFRLINAQTVVSGGFTAGGSWAIRFPTPDKIKFCAIVKGRCWVQVDDAEPERAEAGDILLLSSQRSFVLASDIGVPPVDATGLFVGEGGNRSARLGTGDDFAQLGGHVRLDPGSGRMLEDVIPPWIHVRASSAQAGILHWLLEQLVAERSAKRPGNGVVSSQLAQLMLVQILRAHWAEAPFPPGWLKALGDPGLARVLSLMHGDPGRRWQLEELAAAAAMSRSVFAARFKSAAGVPPMTYLQNWRIRLAEQALRDQDTHIAALAPTLGYTSESAFTHAFKRISGMAPKRYREWARNKAFGGVSSDS